MPSKAHSAMDYKKIIGHSVTYCLQSGPIVCEMPKGKPAGWLIMPLCPRHFDHIEDSPTVSLLLTGSKGC